MESAEVYILDTYYLNYYTELISDPLLTNLFIRFYPPKLYNTNEQLLFAIKCWKIHCEHAHKNKRKAEKQQKRRHQLTWNMNIRHSLLTKTKGACESRSTGLVLPGKSWHGQGPSRAPLTKIPSDCTPSPNAPYEPQPPYRSLAWCSVVPAMIINV